MSCPTPGIEATFRNARHKSLLHACVDDSRRNRIDIDVAVSKFLRSMQRQREDGRLCRSVCGQPGKVSVGHYCARGDHSPAILSDHVRDGMPIAVERAIRMNGEYVCPIFFTRLM